MAAKILFDIGPLDQEISVFAISAPMRDYRFIWYLNKNTEYNFVKDEPYIYHIRKQKTDLPFSVFLCSDHDDMFFVSNRSENSLLFNKYRGVDFFLIWERELNGEEFKYWKNTLKTIPGLTLAKRIEGDDLESFQTIVADMEYQRMDRREDK